MVVDPDPPFARYVPIREIHLLPGDHAQGIDREYVQPETVRRGRPLLDILPAVESPAHAAGCAQRDEQRVAHTNRRDLCLLAPDRAHRLAAFTPVALPYGLRTVERAPQGTRCDELEGLGLVPRQNSSGGKDRLLGISKRGDMYLRTLLIHGARSVLWRAKKQTGGSMGWLARLAARRNPNVAAVALANKNARIAWALLAHGREYQAGYAKTLETLAA